MANRLKQLARSQEGMSSFIIVATLAIILSLISLGSIRVSNRNLNNSLASQVQRSAQYAAESGVDQIVQGLSAGTIAPNATNANCSTSSTLISKLGLSKDTAITCALLDSNPTYLAYDNTSTGSSRVITLKVQGPPTSPASILVSWKTTQSTDPSAPPAGFPGSPATNDLNTALTWNSAANNYPPVLQLTFYPVATAAATQLNTITSKTFYLVPYTTGNVANPVSSQAYAAASSTITPSDCAATTTSGATAYVVDRSYDCRAIISGLTTANDHYDLRILPIYKNADVKIQADSNLGAHLSFATGTQSVVDVTAKSGIARERLQARVSLNSTVVQGPGAGNTNPEYALRSAATLCKRLAQDPGGSLYTPVSDQPYCAGITFPGLPPSVIITANGQSGSTTVNKGGTANLGWTVSGTLDATGCQPTQGNADWMGYNPTPPPNTRSESPINATITFGIHCHNANGWGNTSTVTVNVPSVCLYANPAANTANCTGTSISVDYGQKFTLYWVTTPTGSNDFDHCSPIDYTDWGYASQPTFGGGSNQTAPNSIGPITVPTTYTLGCFDSIGQEYDSIVTVTINKPVLNLTPITQAASYGATVFIGWYGASAGNPIKNADSCTPSSSPSQANWDSYNNWLGGPGSMPFTVTGAFNVTLVCTGGGGSTSKTSTVTMAPSSLFIISISPGSVDYGQTSTISWNGVDILPGTCHSGGSAPADSNWNFSGKGVPGSQTATPHQPSPKPTTYTVTCTRGDNGNPISASGLVGLNPPSHNLYTDTSGNSTVNITEGGSATIYYGGRNGFCIPQTSSCSGPIKNSDTCTPTDSTYDNSNNNVGNNDHGNWDGYGGWLNSPKYGSRTLTPTVSGYSGYPDFPYTVNLKLSCTGGGGTLNQTAHIIINSTGSGSCSNGAINPPTCDQCPPGQQLVNGQCVPNGGSGQIQMVGWNVGPLTYYKNLPWTNGQSHDCYYSTNHWASSVNFPYYSDSTGTHTWYVCSAAVQVSQNGFGNDPNLKCHLTVNGNDEGHFGPPNGSGWIQWNGDNGDGQGTVWHSLGPNSNPANDDSGWVIGWVDDGGQGSGYPAQIYAYDKNGYPVYEFQWDCYNTTQGGEGGGSDVYNCVADWPVHYPGGGTDEGIVTERISGGCPPPNTLP